MEIGLDRMVGPSLAFINVTPEFILSDYCRSMPRDRVVFEILEDTIPGTRLIEAVRQLSQEHYRFALDDFAFESARLPLLPFCSFVKVDLSLADRNMIANGLGDLKQSPVKLLAEKVETFEEFDFCKAAGFDYFQGYFFCRPRILSVSRIPPNRVSICRLLSRLQHPDIKSHDIETIVEEDLSLSYRLLRYINSACIAIPRKIDSISHAVRLVGLDHIKLLASLIMLTSLDDKPRELLTVSLVRARMCSLLAEKFRLRNTDAFFTVGLFSTLDAFLDCPMEEALRMLPLSDEIRQALLTRTGPLGPIFHSVLAYERGQWDAVRSGLESEIITEVYLSALEWAQNLTLLFSAA
jgi:EAL and modified HD-GYP domain-containing signal transduction protein